MILSLAFIAAFFIITAVLLELQARRVKARRVSGWRLHPIRPRARYWLDADVPTWKWPK